MASHFQLRSGTDWRTRISEVTRAIVDLYRMQEDVPGRIQHQTTLYKVMSNMPRISEPSTLVSEKLYATFQLSDVLG